MNRVILIKYGELSTKKGNRNFFINTLYNNVKNKLNGFDVKISKDRARMLIEFNDEDLDKIKLVVDKVVEKFYNSIIQGTNANVDYKKVTVSSDTKCISGYPDGSFRPDAYVNRAELAALICNTGASSTITKAAIDVDYTHWAYKAIKETIAFIPLENELYFKPDDLATREDVITALVKQQKYYGVDNGIYGDPNAIYYCDLGEGYYYNDEAKACFDKYIESNLSERFSDYTNIDPEKVKFINYAIDNRIVSGYADNTIRPKDKVTRAELVTMINNFNYMYPDDYEVIYYTGGF